MGFSPERYRPANGFTPINKVKRVLDGDANTESQEHLETLVADDSINGNIHKESPSQAKHQQPRLYKFELQRLYRRDLQRP